MGSTQSMYRELFYNSCTIFEFSNVTSFFGKKSIMLLITIFIYDIPPNVGNDNIYVWIGIHNVHLI